MTAAEQLVKQLELARRDLLELSSTNRLLTTPRHSDDGTAIEIMDESTTEIYRMLVLENATMRFEEGELADDEAAVASGDSGTVAGAEEPDAAPRTTRRRTTKKKTRKASADDGSESGEDSGESDVSKVRSVNQLSGESRAGNSTNEEPICTLDPGVQKDTSANRKPTEPVSATDEVLHTVLAPAELDRRLQALITDAATLMQEQGVNVLYLALGFLRWIDPATPDTPRDAPLILVPVTLDRGRAGHRYAVAWNEGEIETNLTLKTRLKNDFGITLPDIPDHDDLSPAVYFVDVENAIAGQRGWKVLKDDVALWCFSFTKLLMYRDLDPENWPKDRRLEDRPLIRSLLQDGFPAAEPLVQANQAIDSLFDPAQTVHVVDCDSSQALVIEEAARGRSLVIQGPPGTGKSQTITNLIAAAVTSGRTILFVAEKMAALEVVKRRLENIGIGDMCLELHSKKSARKVVLQEVERTLKLGSPVVPAELRETVQKLKERQAQLNSYADAMHQPFAQSGMTPFQVLGELIDLRASGTAVPDFALPEAAEWTAADYEQRMEAVRELSRVVDAIGDPAAHPWRGCRLESILPLDLERLLGSVPQRLSELDALISASAALSQRLGDDVSTTISEIGRSIRTVDALLKAPTLDPQPMNGTIWSDNRQAIRELGDYSRMLLAARSQLSGQVTDAAWDRDVAADCQAYRAYGKSLFRMFRSSYRQARATLTSILKTSLPETFEKRLEVLELLDRRQTAIRKLTEATAFGEKAFGRYWAGAQTDWQRIADWEAWDDATVRADVSPRFRSMLMLQEKREELRAPAVDVAAKLEKFLVEFRKIAETLRMDPSEMWSIAPAGTASSSGTASTEKVGADLMASVRLDTIRDRLNAWIGNPEGLQQWQSWQRCRAAVSGIGNGVFITQISEGRIPVNSAVDTLRFARAEALLRAIMSQRPELERFEGGRFETLIEEFCQADIRRLELARAEVAAAHWQGIGRSQGPEMAESIRILKHEIQKQRRHLPMRELLQKAGPAIQAVKPVFMMSPLSVSQFLDPGTLEFDMLLIDEASQVRPVEALGAAARCRQMVVVGDDKQMPPTQFFGKVLGDVAVDTDAPEMQAGDVESILGLAIARNMPQRMLRWHYRSRHESLIAVSNREFYDNQLYVIPSPEASGELGVKWKYIDNGRFADGRNEVEAQVVAEAVMKHAAEHPKWTLGVAAFSVSQRDAIQDAVEALRRKQPELEMFFDTNAPDPFFIKNLENVQGDERDVIFVSVGYGPNESGRVSLNFGPVSSSGGERRLNVLMTRAKRILQIFSSMKAEDIDLKRATGRGPAVFREYLKFAEHGGSLTTEKTSSESERIVLVLSRLLKERGFDVRTRVGIAGLYVDLAVIDPANPSRYLLGVLIDGETWRSARSTRDRNRTTEGVLTAQGWNIHHLWSPEWFRRPAEQMNRLIERIEAIRSGREKKRDARLASVSSEIERRTGEPDPLSVLVAGVAPVPPAVTRPAGTGEQGGLLSDLVSTGLKVGAAVLVADKGKGLEAALDALSEKDSSRTEKADEKTDKPKKKPAESQNRKKK